MRRTTVVSLLREELCRVVGQMGIGERQSRNFAPFDRMTDLLWRALSSSEELRWIEDLALLREVASAYDLLAAEIDLEHRWQEARSVAGTGIVPPGLPRMQGHGRLSRGRRGGFGA